MVFHRHRVRVAIHDLQAAALLHALEVEAPRGCVAEELILALLEGEEQAALARLEASDHELGHEQRLAGAGGARDEPDRITEEAAAAHLVELGDARGDPLGGRRLGQLDARQRDDDDAIPRGDGKGKLSALVRRAAELQDLDRPAPALVVEQVAEDDDVVGDELLDAVAGDLAVLVDPLSREEHRDTESLELRRDPEQLRTQDGLVGVLDEEGVQRIEGDPRGADLRDGALDPREQAAQVEGADDGGGLLRIGGGVDEDPLPLPLPLRDVPAEAEHVGPDVLHPILEGDEHAGLAVVPDPRRQPMGGKYRLRAAGGAGDEGRTGARQAALGDEVEAGDAGPVFRNRGGAAHGVGIGGGMVGKRLSAASTWAVSRRSPVTRRRGAGPSRTTVGVVRMRYSSARSGFSSTSTVSTNAPPFARSRMARARFSAASRARGES